MSETNELKSSTSVSFCSSLEDDAWHNLRGPNAFESWHFDAVSDDGSEVLVITFYDNYVLSPRFYNNSKTEENVIQSGKHRFPAVSLVYSVNGRLILSSVNEFVDGDFLSQSINYCSVAGSSFRLKSADYGSGFSVNIDLLAFGGRRIRAELEWLLIESDLRKLNATTDAVWNVVAPRADVTGKIVTVSRRGRTLKTFQFRGTGYHDQVTSSNVHYNDLSSRMWGRAHFTDMTVVFDRIGGIQNEAAPGRFFSISNGEIQDKDAVCEATGHKLNRWGLRIPARLSFTSQDNIKLNVVPKIAFRSGFCDVKMLSEIEVDLADGRNRKTIGITEFVDPRRLKSRLFRWISDLRIGREDKSPLF